MAKLEQILAAHPLRKKPYNSVKFSRVDGHGTALYRVAADGKEQGAFEALRLAFEKFGAHCFHCKKWFKAQPLSDACTRDHIRSRHAGGGNHLHNLVFSCGECNRRKGAKDIIAFRPGCGAEYIDVLSEHLTRCLEALPGPKAASPPRPSPASAAGP